MLREQGDFREKQEMLRDLSIYEVLNSKLLANILWPFLIIFFFYVIIGIMVCQYVKQKNYTHIARE
jgi:ABC-type transport system involved in multi-copper enzyme maturation permease subunit